MRKETVPDLLPYWVDKGWRKYKGRFSYAGHYCVGGKRWVGLIQRNRAGRYEAYIWDPPLQQINRNTGHRFCFTKQVPQIDDRAVRNRPGSYRVHFAIEPGSLNHAIAGVEAALRQAINGNT